MTFQSCEFAKVESPEIDPTSNIEFENTISGFVKTASSEEVVSDAKVYVGDVLVALNEEGKFSYSTKSIEIGSYIIVTADGYIESKIAIANQFDNSLSFHYDFYLTEKQSIQSINVDDGGMLQFDGGEAELPADNNITVNNNPVEDIEISITPLDKKTTYGKFVDGAPVQMFNFEPHGAVFEKPLVITFQADYIDDGSNLKYVVLNEETNIWEVQTNTVSFDPQTKTVSVEVFHFSGGGIIDPNIDVSLDTLLSSIRKTELLSNCDCPSTPQMKEFWYDYVLQLSFGADNEATWTELQTLGIFAQLGIPYSQSLVDGQTIIGFAFFPLMGCTAIEMKLYSTYREIKGTYTFNGEIKTFHLIYNYGFSVSPTFDVCPVWSGCHQGC
jgi:hypothetical protein